MFSKINLNLQKRIGVNKLEKCHKKLRIKKITSWVLIAAIVLLQFSGMIAVSAAPTFTITPQAVSSSLLPKRITVSSTESSFTAGESTPYIMQSGSVVESASISSITSTTTEVSFTLSGITNGTYDVRIVDPKGTYDAGNLVIGDASISQISPSSMAKNYSNQEIEVTGVNSNFVLGNTTVEILDSQNNVVNYVDSITAVDSSTSLTFKLKDGLPSGTYSIRLTTDDEVITGEDILEVRGIASILILPTSVAEGYATTTITVSGTNTGFDQDQTTVSIVGQSNSVGNVTVSNGSSLSFSLNSGLEPGAYTIEVKTGEETTQETITVNAASAQVQYQSANLDEIPVGYTSPYNFVLAGTNTSFTSSTDLYLYNGNPDSGGIDMTSSYVSNKNVSNTTSISFQLGTGLDAGTYYVRAITGSQIVTDSFTVVTPEITSTEFNSSVANGHSVPEGYTEMTVALTGENTLFQQGITTVELQESSGKTSTIVVGDATHLSFTLKEALTEGNYTIVVDIDGDGGTTSDQATHQFSITAPSISSVSPDEVINASSTPITMTVIGDDTHFTSATPIVDITGVTGETISNVAVISDTKLTFNLTPSSIVSEGNYGIQITTSASAINEVVSGNALIQVSNSGIMLSPSSVYEDELGSKEINVTGINTNFVQGNTTVTIDDNTISGVTIDSTTQLSFIIPDENYLTEGTHTVKVVDGSSNEFTSSVLVSVRSISITPIQKNLGYNTFDMVVAGDGLTFNTTDKKPTVSISGYGNVTVDDNDINSTNFSFLFPAGLEAGTYTVTITWDGLNLQDTFTVNNITSDIYFKHNSTKATSIAADVEDGLLTLQAWAELIASGDDINITSTANWQVTSGSNVVSVNNGVVALLGAGTATIEVTYDDVTSTINIEVAGTITFDSISITATDTSVDVGDTINITGIATYNNASQTNVTSQATWTSSNTSIATVNAGVVTGVAEGTAQITVTYNGESDSLTITVSEATQETSSGGGGGGGSAQAEQLPTEEEEESVELGSTTATVEEQQFDDGTVGKKFILDKTKTIQAIMDSEEDSFIIESEDEASNIEVQVSSKIMEVLKEKGDDAVLTIKSTLAEYVLPAAALDLEEIKASLGAQEIEIAIIIKEVPQNIADNMEKVVVKQDMQLLTQPVEFKVQASAGDRIIEIDNFKSKYISRKIMLNRAVDVNKAIGVVFDKENDTYRHVPTKFVQDVEGNIIATIKRKSNSIYTVVENDKTFVDVTNHWAKQNVEVLASKLVINGKTEDSFVPEDQITRAEFAALLVRALGLEVNTSITNQFVDIVGNEWYAGVVNTAVQEGLATGYDDHNFKPNKTISREEMAVMVTRALKVAEKENTISDSEKETLIAQFNDKVYISNWAENSVAVAVREGIINGKTPTTFVPKDNATRAEAATMLIRMLKAVEFIN